MKNKPLISLMIPAYNEERYIGKCIDSLRNQTYQNKEIIIVDDGSSDKTIDIVKKYPVKLVAQRHKGLGASRNTGVKYSKGELLAFLDADIFYDKKYIEKLSVPILKGKAIGTFNKEEYVKNTENIWSNCWSINSDLPINRRNKPEDLPDELPTYRLIKRSAYEKVRGFGTGKGYFDDVTIANRLRRNAVCAPGAISYHFNPESLEEVFYSARWIGRGMQDKKNMENFLRYTFINSLRNGLRKVKKNAPLKYFIFKLVYDFGMFCGIFLSFGRLQK